LSYKTRVRVPISTFSIGLKIGIAMTTDEYNTVCKQNPYLASSRDTLVSINNFISLAFIIC